MSGIAVLPVAFYLKIYGKEHHPNKGQYNDDNAAEVISYDQEGEEIARFPESQQSHPLSEAVRRENWPALLSSILVPMLYGGGYYISVVWMAIFMNTLIDPPVRGSFWINLGANVFGLTLTSFFTGWLSDRVGRVKLMSVSIMCSGFFSIRSTYLLILTFFCVVTKVWCANHWAGCTRHDLAHLQIKRESSRGTFCTTLLDHLPLFLLWSIQLVASGTISSQHSSDERIFGVQCWHLYIFGFFTRIGDLACQAFSVCTRLYIYSSCTARFAWDGHIY